MSDRTVCRLIVYCVCRFVCLFNDCRPTVYSVWITEHSLSSVKDSRRASAAFLTMYLGSFVGATPLGFSIAWKQHAFIGVQLQIQLHVELNFTHLTSHWTSCSSPFMTASRIPDCFDSERWSFDLIADVFLWRLVPGTNKTKQTCFLCPLYCKHKVQCLCFVTTINNRPSKCITSCFKTLLN